MAVSIESHIAVYVNPHGSSELYGVRGCLMQKTDETGVVRRVFILPDRLTKSLAASLNEELARHSTDRSSGTNSVHSAADANQDAPAGGESSTAASGESSQMIYNLVEGSVVKSYAESKVKQLQKELFPNSTFDDRECSVSLLSSESKAKGFLDALQKRTKGREIKPPTE